MRSAVIAILLFFSLHIFAQPKKQPDGAEILHKIQKLQVLGSVLYVAAHPDDENTRLIAWLANDKKVRTGYLSMTRGDGGQNLIGPEIREKLGIIRTQELLAARRIDKGEQFFTRANDFGYSKSPEETFDVWGEEKILSDVVWVIRKFKPDVIVTRFPVTGQGGHGHHTASAILAHKAFELAADPKAFPDQLEYVEPWQPKRVYLNTGRWWNPNISAEEEGVIEINVGEYNPLIGTSYSEMASLSRSQHKSQGFGSTGSRGELNEYLEYRKGEPVTKFMEDVDLSWQRVGAQRIGDKIDRIIADYDPANPAGSALALLDVRNDIKKIRDEYWRDLKLSELEGIIKDVLGIYLEAVTGNPYLVPGESVQISLEMVNRSSVDVSVNEIRWPIVDADNNIKYLPQNEVKEASVTITLPVDQPISTPYWLRQPALKGSYQVNDRQLIGKPENDPALSVELDLSIGGEKISYTIPVEYKTNDPVKGELRRPIAIVPPVSMTMGEEIYLFPEQQTKQITVKLKNYGSDYQGRVMLQLPKTWKVSPSYVDVLMTRQLEEQDVYFEVTPPSKKESAVGKIVASSSDGEISAEIDEIEYEHIPTQTLITAADAEFIKLDVKINGKNIGYIEGAGDAIPSTLKELGYEVTTLREDDLSGDLQQYDAIILGIRALNTNDRIDFIMDDLLAYTEKGGVLVLQYNTSFRLKTENFSPYPLTLSRDRVTVEEAPVDILAPNHPVMNYPNKITQVDFENWVQERGLYFPNRWSSEFTPVLGIADPGEELTQGSLLVAPYGKGYYVYTGISWFRQLPAGVPGAIRIFANILSLGSADDLAK